MTVWIGRPEGWLEVPGRCHDLQGESTGRYQAVGWLWASTLSWPCARRPWSGLTPSATERRQAVNSEGTVLQGGARAGKDAASWALDCRRE